MRIGCAKGCARGMQMNKFLASIDRRKLGINIIGYLIVLVLSQAGPPMQGIMGNAIRAYLWVFPLYLAGTLFLGYRRGGGKSE